jgi:hypothetical protein
LPQGPMSKGFALPPHAPGEHHARLGLPGLGGSCLKSVRMVKCRYDFPYHRPFG